MQIPFVGGSYLGRSTNLDAQVCQNLYLVMDQQGGKVPAALMNTPGLVLWSQPGGGEVRGVHVSRFDDLLYAVVGNSVYKLTSGGAPTAMSGNLLTSSGKVWMADNGTVGSQLMIVDGTYGYIVDGTTITQITDADFPAAVTSLTYQDGYFIVSSTLGRFYISASYDGSAWTATDYATAEGDPDTLQAAISAHRELWLLGKTSYEVWYNSGAAAFPFERIQGSFNHVGCSAPGSAATFQGVVVWLTDNRYVVVSEGYGTQKISTPQIDYHFASYSAVSDATSYIYSQEGHTFYVLNFPGVSKTWVYDFATGFWHTRASGVLDNRHPANCHAFYEGQHIVGDFGNGNLYKYDLSKYTDDGEYVRRIRTAQVIHAERKRIFHGSLEIDFEAGVGLVVNDPDTGSGTDPQADLDWSDDGGHTWSNPRAVTIGAMGKYKTRARWNRLGSTRDRIYRLTITDPVKTVILGAYLDAEAGRS